METLHDGKPFAALQKTIPFFQKDIQIGHEHPISKCHHTQLQLFALS